MILKNRATETDIKAWLDANGWFGSSARFHEIELHSIRRPGWLQVFRFRCEAKSRTDERWIELWGAVKDDETQLRSVQKTIVVAFEDPLAQQQQLSLWSQELHGPTGKPAAANWFAVGLVVAVCLAMLGAFSLARLAIGY